MSDSLLQSSSACNCLVALLLAVPLSACMVGPDYRRPDIEVPPAWRLGATEAVEISNIAWWEQFQDPVLSGLVRTALENNKDLAIATANIDQASAQYGIVRSAQFPQVSAGASAERQRVSGSTAIGSLSDGATFNDYRINLSASFELDIWGKAAPCVGVGTREPARQRAGQGHGGADGGHGGRHRLHPAAGAGSPARDRAAHVAEASVKSRGCRSCDSRKARCPKATIGRLNRNTRLPSPRFPSWSAKLRELKISSAYCSAGTPARSSGDATSTRCSSPRSPAVCRASLLERRPDIRQAEQNLVAANADIGVAKAAYFPTSA